MEAVTILGKKIKKDESLADFSPEESNSLIRKISETIKKVLDVAEEELEHDGERIKSIRLKTSDDLVTCKITHVPVDKFGENHAEIRAVMSIKPQASDKHMELCNMISNEDFELKVTS